MLTPRFSLRQDDDCLYATIHAPFTNLSETEVFMADQDFRFFSKPYFLRLHLPHEVVEDDRATAKYEADSRSFIVTAPKKNHGQFFPGLDMLTSLLTPQGNESLRPTGGHHGAVSVGIEVLDAPGEEEETDIDWYFDQQIPESEPKPASDCESSLLIRREEFRYGFAFTEHGVFERLLSEYQELLDIKDPDHTNHMHRRALRIAKENEDFSEDHYLADLYDSDQIQYYLQAANPWQDLLQNESDLEDWSLTDVERDKLIALPKKEYLIEPDSLQSVYYGLIDILFAYCYDLRTTDGEHSSESGWTLAKLSATLSCCEKHVSLRSCIIVSLRRALLYPLYRHYELALRVFQDVVELLQVGKLAIVKTLVDIMPLMRESDGRYIFNQLYIEPYTVWIQTVHPAHVRSLSEALAKKLASVDKEDLNLDLEEIEHVARLTLEDQALHDMERVSNQISGINLQDQSETSDDSSSESSPCSSTSEDSFASSEDEDQSTEEHDKEKPGDAPNQIS
ncbi:protein SHQ1 homolog [Tigriopus californicus]|uniref:protein SHQ1 homolog n=1 Tax=Tigriopus californicus TaxID=6832 RepID=UPI0027DAA91E|nr:protein SHQ1 homolog [Tigriopus californicus]|eukprot:TCALIF_08379-PA protein Name:"Similar to shq1 Protein SHQ1 homolog (Xenopus tropicalis)" AED:0.36 eAED:0.36 QI:0/-1/0/1/-1/1/1/0/507